MGRFPRLAQLAPVSRLRPPADRPGLERGVSQENYSRRKNFQAQALGCSLGWVVGVWMGQCLDGTHLGPIPPNLELRGGESKYYL